MSTQATPSLAEIAHQGLLLYYQGNKVAAFEQLTQVIEIDDHTLLCLGWLQVEQGQSTGNIELENRGISNIELALKRWIYDPFSPVWKKYHAYQTHTYKSPRQYYREHLDRLHKMGHSEVASRLIRFSESND